MSEPEVKLCDELVPNTATPPFEPTWEKFCGSLRDNTGRVIPRPGDPRWKQYHALWGIGYMAALRDVLNYPTKPK